VGSDPNHRGHHHCQGHLVLYFWDHHSEKARSSLQKSQTNLFLGREKDWVIVNFEQSHLNLAIADPNNGFFSITVTENWPDYV
jgi:hypothetical protein